LSVDERIRRRRAFQRVLGNLGVSFFGPLVSGNIAETMFHVGLNFAETIIIAAVAAMFQTGYTVSLEVKALGERKGVPNS
jgi:hypothetical protein